MQRLGKNFPFVEYLVPGNTGRFLGFLAALVSAVYSFTGTEMIGIALGEMNNPRRNVTRAVRACFFRIVFCTAVQSSRSYVILRRCQD